MPKTLPWPGGKRFAFTVFDDTDFATLENVPPVYALLHDLGLRTTKSVWPLAGNLNIVRGSTCAEADYRKWLLALRDQGFEIALHDVTYHTVNREDTVRGLDEFQRLFGHDPLCCATHGFNAQGMYGGRSRLSNVPAAVYTLMTSFSRWRYWRGHVEQDPLFWGDICRQRIKYYRNFVFPEINTLAACPWMPYHDPARPYVNYWFAATEGAEVQRFNAALTAENQDRLEAAGGACIMYTHFASAFCREGKLDATFRRQMERLASKQGWFVPVGELLDYILHTRGHLDITRADRSKLEWKWLRHKIRNGSC